MGQGNQVPLPQMIEVLQGHHHEIGEPGVHGQFREVVVVLRERAVQVQLQQQRVHGVLHLIPPSNGSDRPLQSLWSMGVQTPVPSTGAAVRHAAADLAAP